MEIREIAIAVRNILLGSNVKALSLLNRPRLAVTYASECLFLERLFQPNGDLPQRCIWEAFESSDIPVVMNPIALRHWFNPVSTYQADIIALSMLCSLLKPLRIFEIGTLHGSSALQMASNSPQAEVFTLDLPAEGAVTALATTNNDLRVYAEGKAKKLVFYGQPEASRIRPLYGDSAVFDFAPFRKSIDLFYIDGAHSYEYVKNDTHKAVECVRPGGVIAWHDYGRCGVNGVSTWLNEFRGSGNDVLRIPGGSLAYMIVPS